MRNLQHLILKVGHCVLEVGTESYDVALIVVDVH